MPAGDASSLPLGDPGRHPRGPSGPTAGGFGLGHGFGPAALVGRRRRKRIIARRGKGITTAKGIKGIRRGFIVIVVADPSTPTTGLGTGIFEETTVARSSSKGIVLVVVLPSKGKGKSVVVHFRAIVKVARGQ